MTERRTVSMELRMLRGKMEESPPPPPNGTSVREWFAGLALMNPELMRGVQPGEIGKEAVRLADELIKALASPKTPSQESFAVPQDEEALAQSWNGMANAMKRADTKERQERITSPDGLKRRATSAYGTPPPERQSAPPPSFRSFKRLERRATRPAMPKLIPNAGRYSSLGEGKGDE